MSPKTRSARKRRTTRRSVSGRRTTTGTRRVRPGTGDDGPNFRRLVAARVLSATSGRVLGARGLAGVERLTARQVQTLIDAANTVGRRPRCWLI